MNLPLADICGLDSLAFCYNEVVREDWRGTWLSATRGDPGS